MAHYTLFSDANGLVQYGNPYTQDGASLVFSHYLAQTSSESINSIYSGAGAAVDPNRAFNPFQLGWYVNHQNQKIMFTRSTAVQAPFSLQDAQGLIAATVEYAVANSEMAGGDLFLRRAYTASHKAGLAQLSFDLQVAKDFRKYVENTSTINSVIADSPTSDFSAGWIATLQRAKELGLNRLVDFNALEYLASYRDLENAFGRNKADAERHMIESGIPEGRRVTFDALEYLAANPGLAQALGGIDRDRAVNHYLDAGRNEGRPTRFDATQYVAAHADLADWLGANEPEKALRHYIEYGYREGRTTTFDHKQYLAANPGLKEELGGVDPTKAARHYIETGRREGLPTRFDNYAYLASYPDLWQAFGRNFGALHQHVLDYGLRPTTFDASAYLNAHPDLQAAFGTNLEAAAEHFIVHGRNETWRTATWIGGPDERIIVGGANRDTASYAYASTGMVVDLNAQRTWNGHVGDTLVSIENAIGSYFDDTLITGNGTTLLDGGDGNDTLCVVYSNQASIRGGNGVDTVSYIYAVTGYTIDLNTRLTSRSGIGGGEFLDSIENVVGSSFNDHIVGDANANFIDGRTGDDVIFSHLGSDRVDGGSGNDFIAGWYGNDTLVGGDGDDQIHGEEDDDFIEAGSGNDTLYGGSGNDTIFSHQDNDRVDGGSGNDFIAGWYGNDTLFGSDGNDTVSGEEDHDFIGAGRGNDAVYGGSGYDDLYGEDGDDFLMGNSEDDWLSGGRGRDTFGFGRGDGRDTIRDFTTGDSEADIIAFNSGVMTSFAAVQAATWQEGGDVVIAVTSESSIRLQNVALQSLSAANFTFS